GWDSPLRCWKDCRRSRNRRQLPRIASTPEDCAASPPAYRSARYHRPVAHGGVWCYAALGLLADDPGPTDVRWNEPNACVGGAHGPVGMARRCGVDTLKFP